MKNLFLIIFLIFSYGFIQAQNSLNGVVESFPIQKINLAQIQTKSQKYIVKQNIAILSELPQVSKTEDGFDLLSLKNIEIKGKVGEPIIYTKSVNINLPLDAIVDEIRIINGELYNISNAIKIAPREKPYQWSENEKTTKVELSNIYKSTNVYPENIVSQKIGKDNKNTVLSLIINPVQFIPAINKIKIIKNFDAEVIYHLDNKAINGNNTRTVNSQNIIIAPTSFLTQANTLKTFYSQKESTTSEIIRLSWIDSNYVEAQLPTAVGFANMTNPNIKSNYNYNLARKITAYLLDNASHPNLESITLLGDASIIPPSYYFYIAEGLDDYNRWIPSDLYYASPDYDHVMNFSIGRIPMNTTAELNSYLTKMNNWKTNLSPVWFNNVEVCGGNPFASKFYTGELITLKAINDGYFQGMNVGKNFYTNRKDYTVTIKPYLNNGNVGILYHIGHGLGNTMYFSSGNAISTYTISSLAASTKYPVVFSIACMNGGFDAELVTNADFPDCMGEGLMRAQAGSISYYGSARKATGGPIVGIKSSGEIEVNTLTYMARMLHTCLRVYANGTLRMGEIAKNALTQYLSVSDISDPLDMLTAYEFVYLGDPVLSMLPKPGTNNFQQPEFTLNPAPFEYNNENEPVYYYTNSNHLQINFSNATNSPAVKYNLYEVKSDFATTDLGTTTDAAAPFAYTHTQSAEKLMVLCASANDGKESRVYFNTKLVTNLPPMSCYLDTIDVVNEGNYNLNWTTSVDYDGTISSYTLKEMISPISVLDDCIASDKWLLNKFTLSNGSFYSGTGDSYRATLRTLYPVFVNTGDSLKFLAKYDIENGFDYAYAEVSTDGVNYTVLGEFTGTNNTFSQYKFSLNNYVGQGIYIQFRYKTDAGTNGTGLYLDDIYPAGWFQTINLITNVVDTSFSFTLKPDGRYFYSVKAKDNSGTESGWSNLREISINSVATGINEQIENIAIYPNPTSDYINIYSQSNENYQFELLDGLGRLIIKSNSKQINVSCLSEGMYFLKISKNNEFVNIKKVIVQHK
ncbi:MAG: C25 family cysteine peptidase [Bacteroidota bacterium]